MPAAIPCRATDESGRGVPTQLHKVSRLPVVYYVQYCASIDFYYLFRFTVLNGNVHLLRASVPSTRSVSIRLLRTMLRLNWFLIYLELLFLNYTNAGQFCQWGTISLAYFLRYCAWIDFYLFRIDYCSWMKFSSFTLFVRQFCQWEAFPFAYYIRWIDFYLFRFTVLELHFSTTPTQVSSVNEKRFQSLTT